MSDAAALAVHAAAVLAAASGSRRSTREIAETLSASEAHLSKVLQRLNRVGLVRSVRGPRGGFSLARDPGDITLLEVYEAIEGPFAPRACLLGNAVCGGGSCVMGDLLTDLNDLVHDYLARTTLSVLPAFVSASAPLAAEDGRP